jgi:hypothetical protein
MQPEQQEHPYQFIFDADHKPKKSKLPQGNSKQSRILIAVAGALALIIVMVIIFSLISAASNAGKSELIKAAQQQAELVRISKLGVDRAKGATAKNLAMTTNLSIQSDQTTLVAAMKAQGIKISPKDLVLGKNIKTDATLTSAEQANKFDEVFTDTIQKELVTYYNTLKIARDKTSSKKMKQTLIDEMNHAAMLATAKQ